jgi:hypothetical protein
MFYFRNIFIQMIIYLEIYLLITNYHYATKLKSESDKLTLYNRHVNDCRRLGRTTYNLLKFYIFV